MSKTEQLLQEIIEYPDNTDIRLMYADYLMEQGKPQGEFIHIQCLPYEYLQCKPDLQAQAWRLMRRYSKGWAGKLRHWIKSWQFERGFVSHIKIDTKLLLQHAQAIFQMAPIQHLHLIHANGCLDELVHCAYLSQIKSLTLSLDVHAHVGHEQWWHLKRNLEQQVQHQHIQALQNLLISPYLQQLEALTLTDSPLGGNNIRVLTHIDLPQLKQLDLSRDALGGRDVAEIVNAPNLQNITDLRLDSCYYQFNHPYKEKTEKISVAQALAPAISRLQRLDLVACHLHEAVQIDELNVNAADSSLATLNLKANNIHSQTLTTLVNSDLCHSLNYLDLSLNSLGATDIATISQTDQLANLTTLILNANLLDMSIIQIDQAKWSKLLVLGLKQNAISLPILQKLIDSNLLSQLIYLNLSSNTLQDEGAKLLCQYGPWPRLAYLDVRDNYFSVQSKQALKKTFGYLVRF